MAQVIMWSSIELLHNVIRTLNFLKERDGTPLPRIDYRGKVKLHGTNCAVQVTPEGLFMQSRTGLLTPKADLHGFAVWVEANRTFFNALPHLTVFGEWCGLGVERGMAISAIGGKVFAVFAVQFGEGADARVVYDPAEITTLLGTLPAGMHILPWWGEIESIDYNDPGKSVAGLNRLVEAVEHEDPWVKAMFGITGVGEGLVFYPVGEHAKTNPEELAVFMFKAKGDKHRTVGMKQAVQVLAEVANSVGEFTTLVVTEARLQQGLATACSGECNMKNMGAFVRWVAEDTRKEAVAELEASNLTWEQVQKGVQDRAREWFRAKAG